MRTANGLATRRTKQPRYSESYHHGDQADTGCPDTFAVTPFHAMWAGVAPSPVWSANSNRFRINRGGNRQTNAALHRIAITQAHIHPFIKRRIETGSTKREALRLLKRKLANVVHRTADTQTTRNRPATPQHHQAGTYGRWWIASGRFSSRGYAEGGWGALGLNV